MAIPQISISPGAVAPETSLPDVQAQGFADYMKGLFAGQKEYGTEQRQAAQEARQQEQLDMERQRLGLQRDEASMTQARNRIADLVLYYGNDAPQHPEWNDAWQQAHGVPWPTQQSTITGQGEKRGPIERGEPTQTTITRPMPLGGAKRTTLSQMFPTLDWSNPRLSPYANLTGEDIKATGINVSEAIGLKPETIEQMKADWLQRQRMGQLTDADIQQAPLLFPDAFGGKQPKTLEEMIAKWTMDDIDQGQDPQRDPRISQAQAVLAHTKAEASKPRTATQIWQDFVASAKLRAAQDPNFRTELARDPWLANQILGKAAQPLDAKSLQVQIDTVTRRWTDAKRAEIDALVNMQDSMAGRDVEVPDPKNPKKRIKLTPEIAQELHDAAERRVQEYKMLLDSLRLQQTNPMAPTGPQNRASQLVQPMAWAGQTGSVHPFRFLTAGGEQTGYYKVTSTVEGDHTDNSAHYEGRAIDIALTDQNGKPILNTNDPRWIGLRMAIFNEHQNINLKIIDERKQPQGESEWTGPHLHVEFTGQSGKPTRDLAGKRISTSKVKAANPNDWQKLIQEFRDRGAEIVP